MPFKTTKILVAALAAAALTTQTGKIGFLGPLINDETRRLAASAYLGARYAWTEYLGKDPADLTFTVNWIGFWFNIPGVTSDPTQVADEFFNNGYDVVISGLDTTAKASSVRATSPPVTLRASSRFLSATMVMRIGRPARRLISSALRFRTV